MHNGFKTRSGNTVCGPCKKKKQLCSYCWGISRDHDGGIIKARTDAQALKVVTKLAERLLGKVCYLVKLTDNKGRLGYTPIDLKGESDG